MIASLQQTETLVALLVGMVTLAVAFKSFYNGYIRRAIVNIKRIEAIDQRTEKMYDRQEDNAEAIYYLSLALRGEASAPDPEQMRDELDVDEGLARYSASDDAYVADGED